MAPSATDRAADKAIADTPMPQPPTYDHPILGRIHPYHDTDIEVFSAAKFSTLDQPLTEAITTSPSDYPNDADYNFHGFPDGTLIRAGSGMSPLMLQILSYALTLSKTSGHHNLWGAIEKAIAGIVNHNNDEAFSPGPVRSISLSGYSFLTHAISSTSYCVEPPVFRAILARAGIIQARRRAYLLGPAKDWTWNSALEQAVYEQAQSEVSGNKNLSSPAFTKAGASLTASFLETRAPSFTFHYHFSLEATQSRFPDIWVDSDFPWFSPTIPVPLTPRGVRQRRQAIVQALHQPFIEAHENPGRPIDPNAVPLTTVQKDVPWHCVQVATTLILAFVNDSAALHDVAEMEKAYAVGQRRKFYFPFPKGDPSIPLPSPPQQPPEEDMKPAAHPTKRRSSSPEPHPKRSRMD